MKLRHFALKDTSTKKDNIVTSLIYIGIKKRYYNVFDFIILVLVFKNHSSKSFECD